MQLPERWRSSDFPVLRDFGFAMKRGDFASLLSAVVILMHQFEDEVSIMERKLVRMRKIYPVTY